MNPCYMYDCFWDRDRMIHVGNCPINMAAHKINKAYRPDPVVSQEMKDADNGIGTVRFHLRDGSSFELKKVMFDEIGGDPNGHRSDTVGEFENGNTFHIPNVLWWEVI